MAIDTIEKYRNRMMKKTLLNLKEKEEIKKWGGLSKNKEKHLENILRRRGATKTNKIKGVKLYPPPKRQRVKKKVKPQGMKNMGLKKVRFAD